MDHAIVNKHTILEVRTGSHLYGTNTPESDEDFVGIFIAPKKFYLGLDKVDECDMSVISKDESGKNDKFAIDRKFYEFRKFVRLAMECNPNILEIIFVDDKNVMLEIRAGTGGSEAGLFAGDLIDVYMRYGVGR